MSKSITKRTKSAPTVQRQSTSFRGRDLPGPLKAAIVADKALGLPNLEIAEKYKVHRNTVSRLCQDVRRNVPDSALAGGDGWRQELDDMAPDSVAAVRRSINDQGDIHKAARTGLEHLKGIGALRSDGQSRSNVIAFVQQINALPEHLRKMFHSDPDVITTDVTDAI